MEFKHLYDDWVCFVFELASGYVRASFLIQIKWCKLEIWKMSVTSVWMKFEAQ